MPWSVLRLVHSTWTELNWPATSRPSYTTCSLLMCVRITNWFFSSETRTVGAQLVLSTCIPIWPSTVEFSSCAVNKLTVTFLAVLFVVVVLWIFCLTFIFSFTRWQFNECVNFAASVYISHVLTVVIGIAHIVCRAGSMKRHCRFAAVGPAGRRLIDCCSSGRQMRAVPHCQRTCVTEQRLVLHKISVRSYTHALYCVYEASVHVNSTDPGITSLRLVLPVFILMLHAAASCTAVIRWSGNASLRKVVN